MPRGRPKKRPDAQENDRQGGAQPGGRVNKMQCVREALQELGDAAQPKDLQDFLKRRFGLDMTTKHISTYKGGILKGKSGRGAPLRRPATQPVAPGRGEGANGGISVEDVRAV